MAIGVLPGWFEPLYTADLAFAEAAVAAHGLERLDLVMSAVALEKEDGGHEPLDRRTAAIEAVIADRPHLRAGTTEAQLIADIAEGYDVCIVGADKWHQLHDVRFYGGSAAARDAALVRLPPLAIAPRDGVVLPDEVAHLVLVVGPEHGEVSSTAVRHGREEWRAR
jgi:nicotinic acid mononucleotide adenylyltransferase